MTSEAVDTDLVYVEGGLVQRVATVPTDRGVEGVVRFAGRTWTENLSLHKSALVADRQLGMAETALLRLRERVLDTDVAIALAAVQAAREHL